MKQKEVRELALKEFERWLIDNNVVEIDNNVGWQFLNYVRSNKPELLSFRLPGQDIIAKERLLKNWMVGDMKHKRKHKY